MSESAQWREQLLSLARQTAAAVVAGGQPPAPPADLSPDHPLSRRRGLFVTLRVGGELRGCMGTFHPDQPLAELVSRITRSSLNDPRFGATPIRPDELDRLDIELSVLSPMQPTRRPLEEFRPGVHGIYVSDGLRAGCFLPQVADETGWGAADMLRHCCAGKAGMDPDAWRDGRAEVFLFTAEVFCT